LVVAPGGVGNMEKRTYYRILGVPRTESPGGIRAAYRDWAKKLHPDIAGEGATRAFLEVTEAYDVLSDAEHRREYNDRLRQAEVIPDPRRSRSLPQCARRLPARPRLPSLPPPWLSNDCWRRCVSCAISIARSAPTIRARRSSF
jgi:curved DNA-binding protein CbpA